MTQKLLYGKVPLSKKKDERLFAGFWLRWNNLTKAEKYICANIVLFPIWWMTGLIIYISLLLLLGVFYYEWRCYGKIRFKRPSLAVLALFAFNSYDYIDSIFLFLNGYSSIDVPSEYAVSVVDLIKGGMNFLVWPGWVWYIQSHNVRVRLEPVAWACSVSVAQMLLLWLFLQLRPEFLTFQVPTLYHTLTGTYGAKGTYLMFYEDGRHQFFFSHFQAVNAFLGFVALMSMDLKNRIWSLLLLTSCIFLMGQTGTRSGWLALPIALAVRFLMTVNKNRNAWLILLLSAIISFATLSFPPITNWVSNTFQNTTQTVGDARRGSTEARAKVYQQTLERIPDKPIFGHKVLGPPAIEGPKKYIDENKSHIGSHSFILGDLLYIKGLVGLGIYATFWGSLLWWFYQTRDERPLFWLPVQMLFFAQIAVTSLYMTMSLSTLLCMVIRHSQQKPFHKRNYA
jgi:hypothetical protein